MDVYGCFICFEYFGWFDCFVSICRPLKTQQYETLFWIVLDCFGISPLTRFWHLQSDVAIELVVLFYKFICVFCGQMLRAASIPNEPTRFTGSSQFSFAANGSNVAAVPPQDSQRSSPSRGLAWTHFTFQRSGLRRLLELLGCVGSNITNVIPNCSNVFFRQFGVNVLFFGHSYGDDNEATHGPSGHGQGDRLGLGISQHEVFLRGNGVSQAGPTWAKASQGKTALSADKWSHGSCSWPNGTTRWFLVVGLIQSSVWRLAGLNLKRFSVRPSSMMQELQAQIRWRSCLEIWSVRDPSIVCFVHFLFFVSPTRILQFRSSIPQQTCVLVLLGNNNQFDLYTHTVSTQVPEPPGIVKSMVQIAFGIFHIGWTGEQLKSNVWCGVNDPARISFNTQYNPPMQTIIESSSHSTSTEKTKFGFPGCTRSITPMTLELLSLTFPRAHHLKKRRNDLWQPGWHPVHPVPC